jgi:hypothetical protein
MSSFRISIDWNTLVVNIRIDHRSIQQVIKDILMEFFDPSTRQLSTKFHLVVTINTGHYSVVYMNAIWFWDTTRLSTGRIIHQKAI